MKNMILSFVAIGFTALCVTYMISSNKQAGDVPITANTIEKKTSGNTKNDVQVKKEPSYVQVTKGLSNSSDQGKQENATQVQQQTSSQVQPAAAKVETPSVYPVYVSDIKKQLTQSEKESIFSIATKLAPIEYSLAIDYLKKSDSESLVKLIRLLNLRLGDKEFLRVREATVSAIDYAAVDKRMKK